MASVGTYLNFNRNTEEVFNFYETVFGTRINGIMRMGDMTGPDGETMAPDNPDANLVAHVSLPITGGHVLMGTDAPESMGMKLVTGNNVSIMVMPDTREEADRLFNALSAGGTVDMPMADQSWGDYFGSCADRFGINWMFDVPSAPQGA